MPTAAEIASFLTPGGPLDMAFQSAGLGEGFEPRPQQTRMAEAVARTLERRGRLLVEAGTGVGKSFAYLVPAALRIVEQGERVVIATNTIALQEQLLKKDVPIVRAAVQSMGADFRPVLVKGRGNYLSIRRLQLASERQDSLFPDTYARQTLHTIEDWAYSTTDGTLASLPMLERPAVWERVQSDVGNCMGRRCPTYEKCFYQRARREMESGELLICNHALFFSDLALRASGVGLLPKYDHVILDEAHNVEDVASEHFGASLTEGRIRRLLTLLYHPRTGKGFLSTLTLQGGQTEALDDAVRAVLNAEELAAAFFDRLLSLTGGVVNDSFRLRAPNMVEDLISPAFRDLSLRLKRLREVAAREDDKFEINAFAERALAIALDAGALIEQTIEGAVYWVEVAAGGGGGADDARAHRLRVSLACSPIEVAPLLSTHLFAPGRGVVLTSATLASTSREDDQGGSASGGSGAFAHALARFGADKPRSDDDDEPAATLLLGSPFDYASQVRLYVDRSMPDPRSPAYIDALAERILRHTGATRGGAFVLFTSFDTLRRTAQRVAPGLDELGLPLLTQERDGPRGLLLEKFRDAGNAVLFGAASFWQGVDVRGDALRNVIITRLPFDPPDRPLTQARLDRIQERGGDPFFEDSLPRAVIKFKQAFGRLIRSADDRGRVVVLDPRIATKGYGRAFLRALPEGVEPMPADED